MDSRGSKWQRIEIQGDEESMPSTEEAAAEATAAGKERVAELEQQLAEAREAHLRVVADLQNFRRRSQEERVQQVQFANEGLISDLLPVLDNFERALGCEVDGEAAQGLLKGICMIEQQLRGVLQSYGAERVATVGEFFDPARHEAVARVESSEVCEGTIVEELQSGYLLNGRLLRPAQVRVAVERATEA